MKVRVVLEFDLEDGNGFGIADRREFVWAAEAAHHAIRSRLMGEGFLSGDRIIGTYSLEVGAVDGTMSATAES